MELQALADQAGSLTLPFLVPGKVPAAGDGQIPNPTLPPRANAA